MNSAQALTKACSLSDAHNLPKPRRKWRNHLFICNCGQGWRLERYIEGWDTPRYRWVEWPS